MKKKYLCGIMIFLCAVGFCGCGRPSKDIIVEDSVVNENPMVETSGSKDITGTGINDGTDAVDKTEGDTSKMEEAQDSELSEPVQGKVNPSGTFLKIGITEIMDSVDDEQNDRYQAVKVEYEKAELLDDCAAKYPALQNALEEQFAQTEERAKAEFQELRDMYFEFGVEEAGYISSYDAVRQLSIQRADSSLLCLLENYFSYSGGAHGYYSLTGYTYDVESGRRLALSDVIADEAACKAMIKEKVLETHEAEYLFIDVDTFFDELSLDGAEGEDAVDFCWSMDYSGVTVYFNPYAIAAYAEGIVEARLPFSEKPEMFVQKYAQVPEAYVEPLDTWSDLYVDLDRDGKEEKLGLTGMETDYAFSWNLYLGDEQLEDPVESYENDSYLVHIGDRNFLYLFDFVENDAVILSILDVNTRLFLDDDDFPYGGLARIYHPDSWLSTRVEFTDPHCFELKRGMDYLSTYTASRVYHVGADGKPESDETFYSVDTRNLIKTMRDIKCNLVDVAGNVLQEDAVIPAGTLLRIVGCDGVGLVDVQAADYAYKEEDLEWIILWQTDAPVDLTKGTLYRISVIWDDNDGQTVGGVSIYELFDGMMFAG